MNEEKIPGFEEIFAWGKQELTFYQANIERVQEKKSIFFFSFWGKCKTPVDEDERVGSPFLSSTRANEVSYVVHQYFTGEKKRRTKEVRARLVLRVAQFANVRRDGSSSISQQSAVTRLCL